MVAGFRSTARTPRELQVARVHPKPGTADRGALALNKPRVCNLQEAPPAAAPAPPKEPAHVWCLVRSQPESAFCFVHQRVPILFSSLEREQFVLVAGRGKASPTSR